MLGVYLLSMALGSFAASRRAERSAIPAAAYGLAMLAGAIGIVVGLALWSGGAAGRHYARIAEACRLRLPSQAQVPMAARLFSIVPPTLVLVALPAFVMGYAFPFAGRFFTQQQSQAARRFGAAYMLNGLGCMLGPLVAGFLLLPWLGMQGTLLACAAVLVLCGCLLRVMAAGMPRWQAAAVFVVFSGIAMAMPERILDSLFADRAVLHDTQVLSLEGGLVRHVGANRIIFHEEDSAGSVLVIEQDIPDADLRLRRLFVGPTSMITDNFAAQRYTKLIGQLPALLHEDPRRALVICLGTGMTLSGVAAHADIEKIDCAEISPAVTRAVHCYDHVNGDVMDDPRVRLIVNDGRTHLAATSETYDIIALEPPPPDNDGAASLYSREFYRICLDRLNEGGMVAQWIPYHLLTLGQIKSVIAAMLEVFPQATLWELYAGTEFCLIGHSTPGRIPYGRVVERMAPQAVLENLAPGGIRGPEDIATCFVARTDALRAFVGDARAVTDDRPRIGYDLRNLGLLTMTETNPLDNAMRNARATYDHAGTLSDVFEIDDDENAMGERYNQVQAAFLMDRKLSLIAALGPDAITELLEDGEQPFVAPHTLDAENPLYRERPHLATYIAAMAALVRHHESKRELLGAMQYRMQAGRLKRLLPENYLKGALYKEKTR
jgi:spermidine synthase